MKVNRLEHLVHLKDMRIQDLTQHLETYKTKGKASWHEWAREGYPTTEEEKWSKAQARVSEISSGFHGCVGHHYYCRYFKSVSCSCSGVNKVRCATCVCLSCAFHLHKCLFLLFPPMPPDFSKLWYGTCDWLPFVSCTRSAWLPWLMSLSSSQI